MAKKQVYVVLFEGFSDWEAAYILPELQQSEEYSVVSVGYVERHVTSMGGLAVTTDITFDEMKPESAGLLLLPGGAMWENDSDDRSTCAVKRFHDLGIPVAAICGATLVVARTGLLNDKPHTSNSVEYLQQNAPGYTGSNHYDDRLAVSSGGIITAGGAGSIEFAKEIMAALNVKSAPEIEQWYNLFKFGKQPVV